MRVPRIYVDLPLATDATAELPEDAAGHLIRVLRMRAGQDVVLFNGDGQDYPGTITEAEKRAVSVRITAALPNNTASPLATELGLALSKGERFDWAIQKATELGVSRISPLFTDRVEVRLNNQRMEKKQGHWQKIVIAACEQSGRSTVPEVAMPIPLDRWCNRVDSTLKLVLDHRSEVPLPQATPFSVALLIGPEGGLSEEEIGAAVAAGFQRWRLGPRVMRTETAPTAALAVIGSRWGDLSG